MPASTRSELGAPVEAALQVVFGFLEPLLFRLRPADVARFAHPPPELFARPTLKNFMHQYYILRQGVIPDLLAESEVAEKCLKPVASGTTRIVEHELYKVLMTLSFRRVQKYGIWHVLRLYHRLVMAGGTSEALAESVCSTLTMHVRACPGRLPALGDVVNAARLRSAGVSGSGRDAQFIERCLNIYFRGKAWHVLVGRRALEIRAKAHPDFDRHVSPALRHYRSGLSLALRFPFVYTGLGILARSCGRNNISVTIDGGSGSDAARAELVRNPKAGLVLRQCKGAVELIRVLREMICLYKPTELSEPAAGMVRKDRPSK